MSRVKLTFPTHTLFQHSIQVRITDINYGQHLANDVVLKYCQETRFEWLRSLNQSELHCFGVGLIMADCQIRFSTEAFAGDDLLVELSSENVSRKSFDFYYRIKRADTQIVIAKTGMVTFDYATKSPTKLPESLRTRLS